MSRHCFSIMSLDDDVVTLINRCRNIKVVFWCLHPMSQHSSSGVATLKLLSRHCPAAVMSLSVMSRHSSADVATLDFCSPFSAFLLIFASFL